MTKRPAKTGSETVAGSQERLKARGGIRFPTIMLSPVEAAQWGKLVARHGGKKLALIAAMHALDSRAETDWPAELRRLAAEIEARDRLTAERLCDS